MATGRTTWTVKPGTNGAEAESAMRKVEQRLREDLTPEVREAWDCADPDVKTTVLYGLVDAPTEECQRTAQRTLEWFLGHLDAKPEDELAHHLDMVIEDHLAPGEEPRCCPFCQTAVEGFLWEGLERFYVGGFVYSAGGGGKGIHEPFFCHACGQEITEGPYSSDGIWFASAKEFADYEESRKAVMELGKDLAP